jgi:HK97 family phage portal protein
MAGPDGRPLAKRWDVVDDSGRMHVGLSAVDILELPHISMDGSVGLSPIAHARQAVGLALAAERSNARFLSRGSQLEGVIEVDAELQEHQAKALKTQWRQKMSGPNSAGEVAILDSNAKFRPLTMPLKDAQYLETRRFEVYEIGRFYGIPPFLQLETEKSTSWGTALEQQATAFVVFDLHPQWLAPTEQRITKELLFGKRYASYNVEGLLRGDSKARGEFYRVMREIGAYSANDIRELENRPPIPGGDIYLQPLNFAPLGTVPGGGAPPDTDPADPGPDPDLVEPDQDGDEDDDDADD